MEHIKSMKTKPIHIESATSTIAQIAGASSSHLSFLLVLGNCNLGVISLQFPIMYLSSIL